MGLDANQINDDVENMWKTMYKLGKAFSDQAGPRRVAETVRSKIERFKQYMPLLMAICNPGIRERHWRMVWLTSLVLISENSHLYIDLNSGLMFFI